MKHIFKKLIYVYLLFGMSLIHVGAFAQGIAVSGTVSEASGETLPGVNVVIKGTMVGTVSDVNGRYSITVPDSDAVLVFTSVGFATQEVLVGTSTNLNVTMLEDANLFDEIVVVGYGVQRRATVTGAVAQMQGTDLASSPATGITQGIVGRMPGVIGYQRADEPGGGGLTIRVRGTTTSGYQNPLYVVDGIPDRDGGINRISPDEIESITVLKDASAAIYGSRAANGVVLVTTKRGVDGKPVIKYSGSWGFSQPTRLPDMCDAFEYATLRNEISTNVGGNPLYTPEQLQKFKDGSDPWNYPNTNYYEQGMKKVSPMYRHELNASGGNDRARYFLSISGIGEDGIFLNSASRYDQYSIRSNLDLKINDYVSIAFGTSGRYEKQERPIFSNDDIFASFVRSMPTMHGFLPNGQPGPDLEYGHQPVMMASKGNGYDTYNTYYLQNNLRATIQIPGIEGLTITPTVAYDKRFYLRKRWRMPVTLYSYDASNPNNVTTTPFQRGVSDPDMRMYNIDFTSWMANLVVNYDFSFGSGNNMSIMAGTEAQNNYYSGFEAYRKFYLATFIDEMEMSSSIDEREATGYAWEEARLNYFGRVSYNFQERYLLDFVWRYDGSYRFPKESRYGFFPGVMAAWRVSEEDFWKNNVPGITFFKLRGSFSQTGSDMLIDNDRNLDRSIQYLTTYRYGTDYLFGNRFERSLQLSRAPNPNITWEVQTEYNLGVELRMLKNRLTFESDVYLRQRKGMLMSRAASLPHTSGLTAPRENIGEMSNRGIEALLRWDDRTAGGIQYYAAFNMTFSKDRMDFIDEAPATPAWQKATGRVWDSQLFYEVDGVFTDQAHVDRTAAKWSGARPGDIIFRDVNGDGRINAEDRVRLNKRREPNFISGLVLGGNWKGFNVELYFMGSAGGYTYIWRERAGEAGNFFKHTYKNRWTPENKNPDHPRVYNREVEYWARNHGASQASTYYIWNTNHIRLRNAEIGYSFENLQFIKDLNIRALRLYVQGSNLFTIDKMQKIMDPEQNDNARQYPQRRIFMFGASLTF